MNPAKDYMMFKQIKTNLKCQEFWLKDFYWFKNRTNRVVGEKTVEDVNKEQNRQHIWTFLEFNKSKIRKKLNNGTPVWLSQ